MTAPLRRYDAAPAGPRFPKRIEAVYQRVLLDRLRAIHAAVWASIEPVLTARAAREASFLEARRTDARRLDAPPPAGDGGAPPLPFDPAELASLIRILVTVEDAVDSAEPPALATLLGLARQVDGHATNEVMDQVRERVANIDVFAMPAVKEEYQKWAATNVDLITSIDATMFDQVRAVVTTALREGRDTEDVRRIIQGRFGVSESRARLIARDQIAKLNGDITQKRQTDLGIEEYQWSTSGDERVRRRHERLDGTFHKWDDPPIAGERGERGHPGRIFQCRCVSLAVIDDEDKAGLVRRSAERQGREAKELQASPIANDDIIPIRRRAISESRKAEFRGGYRSIEKKRPTAPPPPPPPIELPPPPPEIRHQVILHQKTGTAQGSNQGGFYTGTDDVDRYVKFYDDPTQAAGEHTANRIYRDLGIAAPESELFRGPDGRMVYASKIMENDGTLSVLDGSGTADEKKAAAQKALDGFAADVLTANWDAAGLSMDNMVRLKDGSIARIDNGGALLSRAQGARKADAHLAPMAEWWKYLDGSNPGYKRLADRAGVTRAQDIVGLDKQIETITRLRAKHGSWANYLEEDCDLTERDRTAIAELLERRTAQLEQKRRDLLLVRKMDAAQEFTYTGEARNWGDANLAPLRKKVTAKQEDAVRDYTGNSYSDINIHLRKGGKPSTADVLRDKAIAKCKLEDDLVVYRGSKGCDAILKLIQGGAESEGNLLTDPAYNSSTLHKQVAESFSGYTDDKVVFKILLPKGAPAMWVDDLSQNAGEAEVLLPRGGTIRVISSVYEKEKRRWLVHAEMLPVAPPASA